MDSEQGPQSMCLCDMERNVQLGQEGVRLSAGLLRLTLGAATCPASGQSSLFFPVPNPVTACTDSPCVIGAHPQLKRKSDGNQTLSPAPCPKATRDKDTVCQAEALRGQLQSLPPPSHPCCGSHGGSSNGQGGKEHELAKNVLTLPCTPPTPQSSKPV